MSFSPIWILYYEHVFNMNNHFKGYINLLNSHRYVLSNC